MAEGKREYSGEDSLTKEDIFKRQEKLKRTAVRFQDQDITSTPGHSSPKRVSHSEGPNRNQLRLTPAEEELQIR
jgi:hypothetical protein